MDRTGFPMVSITDVSDFPLEEVEEVERVMTTRSSGLVVDETWWLAEALRTKILEAGGPVELVLSPHTLYEPTSIIQPPLDFFLGATWIDQQNNELQQQSPPEHYCALIVRSLFISSTNN